MPWNEQEAFTVSQLRLAFVQAVRVMKMPVAQAARKFGVSRQTGHLWLRRFDASPQDPFTDRSRRPRSSPHKSSDQIEAKVLAVRDQYRWGARKIRAFLRAREQDVAVPSIRTVNAILVRHKRIIQEPKPPKEPCTRFERATPNELWQLDFLQDLKVAHKSVDQFTILDDHSRYLLAMPLVKNRSMVCAWEVLWRLFGEVGLPETLLCDNGFGSNHAQPKTISWLQAQLIRLGIGITHGRPYHPQTQGKVERIHRSMHEEFLAYARHDSLEHFIADGDSWRTIYNTLRPHEAIGDVPPLSRWEPSPRKRPDKLPEIHYERDAVLRRVCDRGQIRWHKARLLAGYGLAGQFVRVEELTHEINIYYGPTLSRTIPITDLKPDHLV